MNTRMQKTMVHLCNALAVTHNGRVVFKLLLVLLLNDRPPVTNEVVKGIILPGN